MVCSLLWRILIGVDWHSIDDGTRSTFMRDSMCVNACVHVAFVFSLGRDVLVFRH